MVGIVGRANDRSRGSRRRRDSGDWSDVSSSYYGDDASDGRTKIEMGVAPDVLYSVNYIDRNHRLFGVIGSNEPLALECSGPDADGSLLSHGNPVIEIRMSAVCSPKEGTPSKLAAFKNMYCAVAGPEASDADKAEAIRLGSEYTRVSSRFNVETLDNARMIIHSSFLQNAIEAVEESARPLKLNAPYIRLFHLRKELAQFRDNQPDSHDIERRATTTKHINVLLDFLEAEHGEAFRAEERRQKLSPPMATFDSAWMLYKPGEIAYSKRQGRAGSRARWQALVIKSVSLDTVTDHYGSTSYVSNVVRIQCSSLAFINGQVRPSASTFKIAEFTGEQTIESLPLVPQQFFPENPPAQGGLSMAQWRVKLGREFWSLLQAPAYKEYIVDDGDVGNEDDEDDEESKGDEYTNKDNGPSHAAATDFQKDSSSRTSSAPLQVERIVVDIKGFVQFSRPGNTSPNTNRPANPIPGMPYAGPSGFRGGVSQGQPLGVPSPIGMAPTAEEEVLKRYKPQCLCEACEAEQGALIPGRFFELCFEFLDTHKKPKTDIFYQLCDTEVSAFLLSKRQWIFVDITQLRPVQPDYEAFESLVLDDEIKHTVRALVGKFAHGANETKKGGKLVPGGKVSPWPRDIVKNKGEGRIFLLHGSPGVGKTCTAECIAELAQRPLLALTSGDISTNMHKADSVERNLDMYLRLGERYGALVLLDEADVFLEARRASDLYRNGLVSVFLRALEYFRGVLFLTTNRVESFDAAFTSRIHVALHYQPLSIEDRRRVWAQHFACIERDSGGRIFVLRSAREYAYDAAEVHELQLNGREIRNALQTAVALAEADAAAHPDSHNDDGTTSEQVEVVVKEMHLRAIVKMSRGFKSFMIQDKANSK